MISTSKSKFLAFLLIFTYLASFSDSVPLSKIDDSVVVDDEEYEEEDEDLIDIKIEPIKGANNKMPTDSNTKSEDYDDANKEEDPDDPMTIDFDSLDDDYENEETVEPEEVDQMSLLRTLLQEKRI